jgi:hypothetical protein
MVTEDSPIRGYAGLAGKTIAVNALENVADVTLKAALDEHGVDHTQVKYLEVRFADMLAALDAGRVDAAFLAPPFETIARRSGGFRSIGFPFVDVSPSLCSRATSPRGSGPPNTGTCSTASWRRFASPCCMRPSTSRRLARRSATTPSSRTSCSRRSRSGTAGRTAKSWTSSGQPKGLVARSTAIVQVTAVGRPGRRAASRRRRVDGCGSVVGIGAQVLWRAAKATAASRTQSSIAAVIQRVSS